MAAPTLTTDQLLRLRRQLGAFEASFTDAELQAYHADAYDTIPATAFPAGALAQSLYALLTGAINLTNYRQGETSESNAVIYDRLTALWQRWAALAGEGLQLPTVRTTASRVYQLDLPGDAHADC